MRITLHDHDPRWAQRFAASGAELRDTVRDRSVVLHHIGSTSVTGLAAKDVLDIQMSVPSFEPFEALREAIEVHGYVWHDLDPDHRKRFFSLDTPAGKRSVNLHVRVAGEFSQVAALLFRDFLRSDPAAAEQYGTIKRALAEREWIDVEQYADAKGDVVWKLLHAADRWAAATGWFAPPGDA